LRSSRLVTVVGTGGVGKTRLVAEHVERARSTQRVLVVELSAIASPDVLVTLGAHLGVREERIDLRTVAELLRPHDVLLVLDNAEHVVADVRELASTVLRSCPDVRLLVTSRERLDLADEVVVGVAPLRVDSPDAEAVTLFVDRMRRVRPHVDRDHDRPRILDICRRVDGMPLAIELAASRAASLGVDAVVDRFDALFGPLLGVAADADRHSTLGNVVSWSIDLLGEPAQDLLSALSIFSGEFTVEAAVAVGGAIDADSVPLLLGRLVDTSLVTEAKGAGRFRLLEMIRAVARERLVRSGRRPEVQRAHAGWVAQCVAGVAADALGPRESGTSAAIDALRHELGHALDWAIGTGDIATAATITRALGGPLLYRPDADLIRQLRGLGGQRSIVGSPDEAVIVATDARAAFLLGDLEDVDALAHRAIALSADDRAARHRAEHALGVVRLYQGRFTESEELFLPASASPTADTAQHLDALGGLALARCYAGDTSGALAAAQQLAAAADTIDSDTYRAFADYALGELELANGDVDAAVARLAAAADRSWEVGARFVWGVASTVLARVLVRHRPAEEARRQLPTLIERWRHTTTWPQLWTTLRLTAEHLVATGQPSVALLIVEAAAVDPAAPTLSDDDLARRRLIRERVGDHLGAATVTGIARGAVAVERTTVVERALDALRHPIDG
jgi:predicted ATPase